MAATGAAAGHFLILYASQTGNAQSIAEGLREEAEEKGFNASVYCTNEFDKDNVSDSVRLVSTGQGQGLLSRVSPSKNVFVRACGLLCVTVCVCAWRLRVCVRSQSLDSPSGLCCNTNQFVVG